MKRAYVYRTVGANGGQKTYPSRNLSETVRKPIETEHSDIGGQGMQTTVIRKPQETIGKAMFPASGQKTYQYLCIRPHHGIHWGTV